jgi:hypothetical protein
MIVCVGRGLLTHATIGQFWLLLSIIARLYSVTGIPLMISSRRKKTRCTRQIGQTVCDTCAVLQLACTYDDRDRYQAERDRRYASLLAPLGDTPPPSAANEAGVGPSAGPSTFTPLGSGGASIASFRSATCASMILVQHIDIGWNTVQIRWICWIYWGKPGIDSSSANNISF